MGKAEDEPMLDWESLSHVRWDCKYHVVFVPKYRQKNLYGKFRRKGIILHSLGSAAGRVKWGRGETPPSPMNKRHQGFVRDWTNTVTKTAKTSKSII